MAKKDEGLAGDIIDCFIAFLGWIWRKITKSSSSPFDSMTDSKEPISNGEFKYPLCVRSFFSKRERVAYEILRDLGKKMGFTVFSKVKLLDLIETDKSITGKERFAQNARIKELHLDFVLLNKDTYEIVGVIEVDDKTHEGEKQAGRDEKKNAALASAGVQIYRVPAGYIQSDDLHDGVEKMMRTCLVGQG